MLQVWLVELDRVSDALEAEERRHPRLSEDDLQRIAALTFPDGARQRRLTSIALRLIIAATAGSDRYDRVPLVRAQAGKPALPATDGAPPLSFSQSHAGGRALIAVTDASRAGVDLERCRRIRMQPDRIAALNAAAAQIAIHAEPTRASGACTDAAALRAWVRLEALAKADGAGMARVLTAAGVMGRAPVPAGHGQEASLQRQPPQGWATPFLASGTVAVRDLALPHGPDGLEWFGAIAADVAGLHAAAPPVRLLPADPAGLASLLRR